MSSESVKKGHKVNRVLTDEGWAPILKSDGQAEKGEKGEHTLKNGPRKPMQSAGVSFRNNKREPMVVRGNIPKQEPQPDYFEH